MWPRATSAVSSRIGGAAAMASGMSTRPEPLAFAPLNIWFQGVISTTNRASARSGRNRKVSHAGSTTSAAADCERLRGDRR